MNAAISTNATNTTKTPITASGIPMSSNNGASVNWISGRLFLGQQHLAYSSTNRTWDSRTESPSFTSIRLTVPATARRSGSPSSSLPGRSATALP